MNIKSPPEKSKMYGEKWRKSRHRFLLHNPLCVKCKSMGIFTQATVVDHITPHRLDPVLFWDATNWQALCKPCHDEKTRHEIKSRQGYHIRHISRCGIDGMPIDPNHPWNDSKPGDLQ